MTFHGVASDYTPQHSSLPLGSSEALDSGGNKNRGVATSRNSDYTILDFSRRPSPVSPAFVSERVAQHLLEVANELVAVK